MRQREIMTRLEKITEILSEEDARALLAFAEFLSARADDIIKHSCKRGGANHD